MSEKLERLIARDVTLCAAMADELGDYLASQTLFWEPDRQRPGGADLPKLTVGGFLLALRRLETLRDRLNPDQLQALTRARQELASQKAEWGVRYRKKLDRGLHSRLDAWAWYLEDCEEQGESAIAHYEHQVETRVKIDLLLEEAAQVGLDAEASRQRQVALDEQLRADFAPDDFVWLPPLADGFPPVRFWYLYGRPEAP